MKQRCDRASRARTAGRRADLADDRHVQSSIKQTSERMTNSSVISDPAQLSAAWVGRVLKKSIDAISVVADSGNWSKQSLIEAKQSDGTTQALRLKMCLGQTFGRSEVDYYTRDYLGMADAPLVRCFDAQYDPGVGYHLLLEDLAATHTDNKSIAPRLDYGIAVAEALGRFHRHHWCSQPVPDRAALDRYFEEVRPGLAPLERATGCVLRDRFEAHEHVFRHRWGQPQGMSLLHGDLNPTNILTPVGRPAPVYFLDRQPFDWSLTYGVAASDLAYFMIPWWPKETRQACELAVLRRWYDALDAPEYSWSQAQVD
jgi:Phosphotransferase enzyme family